LTEIAHADFSDLAPLAPAFRDVDACFFCLGVSSAGMSEAAYTKVTRDLTIGIARALAQASPGATFCYVTGAGTDASEQGKSMWARVKGRTENELLRIFPASYMFRPAIIVPLRGVRSNTRLYQFFYVLFRPLLPKFMKWFPKQTTTSVHVGRAMIAVAANGDEKRILETADINRVAEEMRIEKRLVFGLKGKPGHVGGNHFKDEDLVSVPENTVFLDLECSAVTDAGLLSLGKLPSLRCLDVDSTKITDRSMERIAQFEALEELWVEETAITDAGLDPLVKLKNLKFISVMYTEVTDAGVDRLRAAIPGLLVH
jgi:hypothetical protein